MARTAGVVFGLSILLTITIKIIKVAISALRVDSRALVIKLTAVVKLTVTVNGKTYTKALPLNS